MIEDERNEIPTDDLSGDGRERDEYAAGSGGCAESAEGGVERLSKLKLGKLVKEAEGIEKRAKRIDPLEGIDKEWDGNGGRAERIARGDVGSDEITPRAENAARRRSVEVRDQSSDGSAEVGGAKFEVGVCQLRQADHGAEAIARGVDGSGSECREYSERGSAAAECIECDERGIASAKKVVGSARGEQSGIIGF